VVVRYLVDLELPEAGSSCTPPPDTDVFPPPGEGELDQVVALLDCLRDNGVDVPEVDVGDLLTDPEGGELLDVLDPTDPAVAEAALACLDEMPSF